MAQQSARVIPLRPRDRSTGYGSGNTGMGEVGDGPDATSNDKVAQVRKNFFDAYRSSERWRRMAIRAYQFVSNNQWTEADIQARKARPRLTINKILGQVLWLAGVQRQGRTDATLLPAQDDDVRKASLMSGLLKWVNTRCREKVVDSLVFLDKIITGLGYWKIIINFDDDPLGRPEWERIHPLSVFTDPNWFDSGWPAARFVIHARWMTEEEVIAENEEHADEIRGKFGEWLNDAGAAIGADAATAESTGDSHSDQRLFWDRKTQRIRVLEQWYVERVPTTVAILVATGDIEDDPERVKSLQQRVKRMPELAGQITFSRRLVKRVRVLRLLDDLLLNDEESPFNKQQLPIFQTVGYYFWRDPFGAVLPLMDLQREKNHRRSTIAEVAQKSPMGGWLNKRDTGAKTEDLEKYASGVSPIINYQTDKPDAIDPPPLPQTLVYLEQNADRDMSEVSGINRDLMGSGTQRTVSGKAIEARQRGGLVGQEPLLESFSIDKEIATEFMIAAIQQFVPVSRAARILGVMAQRDTSSPVADAMGRGAGADQEPVTLPELQALLEDTMLTEFDVVVDTDKPFEPTLKLERWKTLKELATEFPGQIPPKVLIKAAKSAGVIDASDAAEILAFGEEQQGAQAPPDKVATKGESAVGIAMLVNRGELTPEQGQILAAHAAMTEMQQINARAAKPPAR